MKYLVSSVIVAFGLGAPCCAQIQGGADITVIGPGGIKTALEQLIPDFERKTGYKVKATLGSGTHANQQAVTGEGFDIAIIELPYPEAMASANLVAGSAKPLASVSLGVAVRAGSPRPDISTAAAVKRLLLAVKAVSYPDPSRGSETGIFFDEAIGKLGITDQMRPKLRAAPAGQGETMKMVARGDVDLAVTFLSEMNQPGTDIVGPLPEEVWPATALVGIESSRAKNPVAASALLDFLASPGAMEMYRAKRMKPAR